jgi:hypothetical protein
MGKAFPAGNEMNHFRLLADNPNPGDLPSYKWTSSASIAGE